MLRVATALIVLFSLASAPLATAVCMGCCNQSVEHRLSLCPDKAHAQLGPHVHHMNNVHMVTQESEASIVTQECDRQLPEGRLRCHTSACLEARPVQASVVSLHQQPMPLHILVSAMCISLSIAARRRPPDAFRTQISSSPSASVPLRI